MVKIVPKRERSKRPALIPLMEKWQRRLNLLNWQIEINYCTREAGDTYVGQVRVKSDKAKAFIKILEPSIDAHDVEHTIIHEMLHIALWDITDENKNALEERFIERMVPLLCKPSK